MHIKGIINVSGKSGLYKIISQSKKSAIVESLIDGKRMPVYSHTAANALEEISIYTYKETIPLINVFINIAKKEDCKMCISHKSSKSELENYFRDIIEDYDEERVYISDIKKIFQWYNSLHSYGLIKLPEEEEEEEETKTIKTKNKNE